MKRITLLFIVFTFSVISAYSDDNFTLQSLTDDTYSIRFNLNEIELEQSGSYTKIITSTKGTTSIIGMPKLPKFSTMVMLDPEKTYSISYNVTKSYMLKNVDIIPNQNLFNGLEKEKIEIIDKDFYNSNSKYPNENIVMSDPMIMRDVILSSLSIIPFNYNPENRELEVYENIEIQIFETGETNDPRIRDIERSRVFENIYKNNIINYHGSSLRDEEYQQPAILYIGPSSIINNATFQQLVEWRKQRGYVVYLETADGASTSSIKNDISEAYDNFDPPPEYISLLGDVGGSYSLPTYYEDHGHDVYGSQCEGDHPYSQLDGNDLLPEVLLGRMSIRSSSELNTVVSKILNYEKATYLDYYPHYYKNAAMAGDPSSSGNSCAITKEVIKESLENHGFGDVDIKTSGSGWANWMQNELSDGVLYFNYRGYLGMSGFNTGNIDNANSGWKLPFATILTCGTGSFAEDETAMSEKFFRAGSTTSPKGGVAAIGTATWNTHTLFNNIVDMGIYDGILADKVETSGAALVSGKFALYNTYPGDPYGWVSAFTHWNNLIGDAATHLWTDTPNLMTVTHVSEISFGTNYLDVQVLDSNENPINDAMVSLLIDEDESATNLFTDDSGQITFSLDPLESNNMTLTVTKLDHKPYQATITTTINNINVNFDNNANIVINDDNDGIATAGETLGLSIPLINNGSQTATNFTATLSTTSNQVIIDNSTVIYDTLLPGSTSYSDNFIITIAPTAKQYEDLELTLEISDGDSNNWYSQIPLDVMGSLLTITNTESFEPGITTSLNISLTNSGMLTASNITGELIYDGNQIDINDSVGSWGTLSSGETEDSINNFNITLSEDIVNGSQLTLYILLESLEGYSSIETYNITVGHLAVTDPLGPDQYGYYIYDSEDDDYELAPNYDWIEINQIGTNLNLSNNGNGTWSGNGSIADVQLPFSFKFYGVEYSEITISTNGWISPGLSNAASFRNYPIPGAGGPTPMIAAFWDDLETGDVYVYSTMQYVIIEWSNMRTNFSNDENTFQVILYNDSAQPNGDNNIKIQYQEFNNTSSGSFTAYPPIHGSYSTIGIENHLSDDGLQYTYYNDYPVSAMPLSNQTALYITTQPPITLPAPSLSYQIEDSEFEVLSGESDYSTLLIENAGEEGSLLYYSVNTAYPEVESPFDITGGGPDSYGYFWSDSDLSNEIDYTWTDISDEGTQVSFSTNDASTQQIDIGFDFPFYGDIYSNFIINANGWIGFGEDNSEWYNGNIPSIDYPRPAIFGFWDDLNPVNDNCNATCLGNVYYHSDSNRLVVWFDNVAHWASAGFENSFYDFQIIIHSSGDIDININSIEGDYSSTVGIQNASGTIASQVDVYNGNYFNDNMSIELKKADILSDWILLISENGGSGISGELYSGESDEINIEIDATELTAGQYFASIIIASDSEVSIPVTLNVFEEDGLAGDLNFDEEVNVLDVVQLIGYITGNSIPSDNQFIASDLNQDNVLNVLDIVALINIILEE